MEVQFNSHWIELDTSKLFLLSPVMCKVGIPTKSSLLCLLFSVLVFMSFSIVYCRVEGIEIGNTGLRSLIASILRNSANDWKAHDKKRSMWSQYQNKMVCD